jgi:hypothetical protein
MTLKGITSKAAPVAVAFGAVLLAIRYGGHLPVIKDMKEGIKGNSTNSWFD